MAGTTKFPAALDDDTTLPDIGPSDQENASGIEHDVIHSNAHAAIKAIEAELRYAVTRTSGAITGTTDRTVPVVDGSKYVNGRWIQTTDGTNLLYGQISAGGGTTTLTISATGMVTIGTPNSIPTGTAVVLAGEPGAAGADGVDGVDGSAGPGYLATSTTSLATVATGSVAFTTQSGLAYSAGARIRATSTGTGEWMEGIVSAYSSATLTVTMDLCSGTGTHADWDINLAGEPGATGGGGGGGYPEGTSFPSTPSLEDKFYRADLDYLCVCKGTSPSLWLTTQEFSTERNTPDSTTGPISANSNSSFTVRSSDIYVTEVEWSPRVAGTNDSSNYWNCAIIWHDGTTSTTLTTLNTQGLSFASPNLFRYITASVNTALSGARILGANFSKTAAPGTCYPQVRINYRLIIT